ncbi:sulfite exporter TauE/SafE family protein [bacterium]|nr:sulfite exporter TauE/SafE family protein [bacterium]
MFEGWIGYLILTLAALAASTVAAVTGFGGAVILLPILTSVVGLREAIPVLTVAQLIGNASRVWFNRRDLHYPIIGWFSLGSIPMAIVGSYLFATAPLSTLTRLLGLLLLVMAAARRLAKDRFPKLSAKSFTGVGAVSSLISALVGSVGPLMAPFFLAHGLIRGSYIGTEAACTVVMHVTKLITYRRYSLLSLDNILFGLAVGSVMILGSYLGKMILSRVSSRTFELLIELNLVLAGLLFLFKG